MRKPGMLCLPLFISLSRTTVAFSFGLADTQSNVSVKLVFPCAKANRGIHIQTNKKSCNRFIACAKVG